MFHGSMKNKIAGASPKAILSVIRRAVAANKQIYICFTKRYNIYVSGHQ